MLGTPNLKTVLLSDVRTSQFRWVMSTKSPAQTRNVLAKATPQTKAHLYRNGSEEKPRSHLLMQRQDMWWKVTMKN